MTSEGRETAPLELFVDIVDAKNVDKNFSFELHNERDASGKEIEAKVHWLKLQHEGQSVEGKFYEPKDKGNGKLILWEPGLPGDGTTWFEEKHAAALVAAGYTVMALRHRGTRTKTDKAEAYVHCPERQQLVGDTLGENREVNMDDLAFEPSIALNILGQKFDEIKIIGHSAGAPFSLHSLRHVAPEVLAKIKNMVSLAGGVGGEGHFAEGFPPFAEYMKFCQTRINLGDPKANEEAFYRIVEEVYKGIIPEHIMMALVHSENDEYLKASGANRLFNHLGRGLNIDDKTQFEPEIHDLKNLRPETLLRLLEMYYPKARHRVALKAREPRTKD